MLYLPEKMLLGNISSFVIDWGSDKIYFNKRPELICKKEVFDKSILFGQLAVFQLSKEIL